MCTQKFSSAATLLRQIHSHSATCPCDLQRRNYLLPWICLRWVRVKRTASRVSVCTRHCTRYSVPHARAHVSLTRASQRGKNCVICMNIFEAVLGAIFHPPRCLRSFPLCRPAPHLQALRLRPWHVLATCRAAYYHWRRLDLLCSSLEPR